MMKEHYDDGDDRDDEDGEDGEDDYDYVYFSPPPQPRGRYRWAHQSLQEHAEL